MTGTAVVYNREATMPAASFYNVGDTWTEATPTFTPVTAELKILGGAMPMSIIFSRPATRTRMTSRRR
ncbi:MAG: hypothetical protein M3354_08010 [Chloroflexota bacterium]|nr:hypothetical protein [Chloroflexota bacterium]